MAQTPLSTATPYITAAQLLNYCDIRTIADYLDDTNHRLGGNNPDPTVVTASPVLAELLLAASGVLETAALAGDRYTPTDLQALTGAGAALLRKITAGLALREIFARRPLKAPPKIAVVEEAEQWLEALCAGQRIFSTQQAADAGLPEMQIETEDDVVSRNGTVAIARPLFGRRMRDYPQPGP